MSSLNPWFREKLSLFQQTMKDKGVQGSFLFHPTDLFYFTGCNLGNLLYVPNQGEMILFTRRALKRMELTHKEMMVKPYKSFRDVKEWVTLDPAQPFGIVTETTPMSLVMSLIKAFGTTLEQVVDITPLIRSLSMVKTPFEIEAITHSAQALSQTFSMLNLSQTLHKTEIEISHFIDGKLKLQGSKGEQFKSPYHNVHGSMVITGDSVLNFTTEDITYGGFGISSAQASGSSFSKIKESTPFIIDAVAATKGYYADMTRTFIIKKASLKFEKRYQDLIKILDYIVSLLKPSVLCSQIYEQTLTMVEQLGYKDHFMGYNGQHIPFIGHSVGVYVDEYPPIAPKVTLPLQENMVIAIEPKFYFEDGDSMGIENTYLITAHGAISLSSLNNDYILIDS